MCERSFSGFTLLELLLATVLSAVVTWDIVQVAVGMQMEICRQEQSMQELEAARAITYFFSSVGRASDAEHCTEKITQAVVSATKNSLVLLQCIHYHERWQLLPVHYFIAANRRGTMSLYRQPDRGSRQIIQENVMYFGVDLSNSEHHKNQGVMIWLVLRSMQPIFSGERCYYFLNRSFCRHDGYDYLAWPVYVA